MSDTYMYILAVIGGVFTSIIVIAIIGEIWDNFKIKAERKEARLVCIERNVTSILQRLIENKNSGNTAPNSINEEKKNDKRTKTKSN